MGQMKDHNIFHVKNGSLFNQLVATLSLLCLRACVKGYEFLEKLISLRATGATRLFEANMPEKLIQERTGHRSTAALRQYEHSSVQQHQSVSSIIASVQSKPEQIGPHSVQPFSRQIAPQYGVLPNNPQLPTLMGNCHLSNFTLNVNFNY